MGISDGAGFDFRHGLAVSDELILICSQAFKPHRAAGMQLAGGDADFSPEAVNKSVGKAGGGVPVNPGTVHTVEEISGGGRIPGDKILFVLYARCRKAG